MSGTPSIFLLAVVAGCRLAPEAAGFDTPREDVAPTESGRVGLDLASRPPPPPADGPRPAPRPTTFVRCLDLGRWECSLQSAIVRYTDGDEVSVTLVAAVHSADRGHFRKIAERLQDHELVLYEGWREEPLFPEDAGEAARSENPDRDGLSASSPGVIRTLIRCSNLFLGALHSFLEFRHVGQWSGILDYSGPRFLNADMTYAEFVTRCRERRELLTQAGVHLRLLGPYVRSVLTRLASRLLRSPAATASLFKDWHQGLRFLYTVEVAEGSNLLANFQVRDDSPPNVTIHERNALVERVLVEKITAGVRDLAIYYGAVHMPDFERRLLERGFRKSSAEWIDCWVVRRESPPGDGAAVPADD